MLEDFSIKVSWYLCLFIFLLKTCNDNFECKKNIVALNVNDSKEITKPEANVFFS